MLDQCCNYICYKHLHGTLITEFSGYELHKYWKFILLIQKKLQYGHCLAVQWYYMIEIIRPCLFCKSFYVKENRFLNEIFFMNSPIQNSLQNLCFSVYITSFMNIYVCHLIPVNGIFLLSINKLNAAIEIVKFPLDIPYKYPLKDFHFLHIF